MPRCSAIGTAADWALMMPLEKSLTVDIPAEPRARLTSEDHTTLARRALKMDQAFALTSKRGVTSCSLQDGFIVLDVNGNATLCCASMASKANTIGNYLATPIEEIQAARRAHAMCKPCMSVGFPLVANFADEGLNEIALRERAAFRPERIPIR